MEQPSRPTRREDVDLDTEEFSWILPGQRRSKGLMNIIKDCYIAGVDMEQFHNFRHGDYVIPTFQKALDDKLNPPPPLKPKSKSKSRGRGSSQPPPGSERHRRRNRSAPPPPVSFKKKTIR